MKITILVGNQRGSERNSQNGKSRRGGWQMLDIIPKFQNCTLPQIVRRATALLSNSNWEHYQPLDWAASSKCGTQNVQWLLPSYLSNTRIMFITQTYLYTCVHMILHIHDTFIALQYHWYCYLHSYSVFHQTAVNSSGIMDALQIVGVHCYVQLQGLTFPILCLKYGLFCVEALQTALD